MRTDLYAELHLWNKNVEALLRLLQGLEQLGLRPTELLRTREAQLEEVRSTLNVEFLNAAIVTERIEQLRTSWWRERGSSNFEQSEMNQTL